MAATTDGAASAMSVFVSPGWHRPRPTAHGPQPVAGGRWSAMEWAGSPAVYLMP